MIEFVHFFLLGYGDIVPKTDLGKVVTMIYAIIAIPIFMWYIFKLGILFRALVMKFLGFIVDCFW